MKLSLPLKLGIAVVAAFALLIISLSIYRPLRFKWLQSRLQSADAGKDKQRYYLEADKNN